MKNSAQKDSKASGCLDRIKAMYSQFSAVNRRIADYAMEHPQKTIYMTVLQMAEACDVSEASIVRFCQNIGYSGFNEMKINLAAESDMGGFTIMDDVLPDDDDGMILEKVFANEMQALQATLHGVGKDNFIRAVSSITAANKIEMIACGNTRSVAQDASYRFLRIGVDVRLGIDRMDSHIHATMLRSGDVAIGISHSGSTKATIQMLEDAQKSGATTICVTGFERTPILRVSDICLITHAKETECSNVAMTSRIAQMAIMDALVVAVGFKRLQHTKKHITKTDLIAAGDKY